MYETIWEAISKKIYRIEKGPEGLRIEKMIDRKREQ